MRRDCHCPSILGLTVLKFYAFRLSTASIYTDYTHGSAYYVDQESL